MKRYLWLYDTISRHGSITLAEIQRLWLRDTSVSQGKPLPRRTFNNYRARVEEMFDVDIVCDRSTYAYSVKGAGRAAPAGRVSQWLLDSASVSGLVEDARRVAGRIFVDDVPSARNLPAVVRAMAENHKLSFTYRPYSRSGVSEVEMEPYFLKIFRQRWYLTGMASGRAKTYALDRMEGLAVLSDTFEADPAFDLQQYVAPAFGVVYGMGRVHDVTLQATPHAAQYLRELPLHPSQSEDEHPRFSTFHYRLRLTPDFVNEIVARGPDLTVVAPRELRAMVVQRLKDTLANYESVSAQSPEPRAESEEAKEI